MKKGKGLKGQKWNEEKQEWYFPEGNTLTVEAVNELLNAALKKQREEILQEVKTNVTDIDKRKAIDKNEIDEEDILQEPKFYFCWGRSVTIDSYTERGRPIRTPYGNPIVFGFMPPQVERDAGGNRQELHWCMAKIWSKKEVAFLENSPYFKAGIIMESVGDLKYEDSKLTSSKMHAVSYVSSLNKPELINACRNKNIPTSNDFNKMRDLLIESMCKDTLGNLSALNRNAAIQSKNAELLLQ